MTDPNPSPPGSQAQRPPAGVVEEDTPGAPEDDLVRPTGGGGLRTIAMIAGGTLGIQAMILTTGIISARLLGVEGRGQIALVVAVSTLVARVTMAGSLPVAISQLLAREGLTARDGLRPFLPRWAAWALLPSAVAGAWLSWLLRTEPPVVAIGLGAAAAAATYLTIGAGIVGGAIQGELASASRVVGGALLLQAPFFVLISVAAIGGWVDGPVTVAALMVIGSTLGLLLCVRLLRPARGLGSTIDRREVRQVSAANYVTAVGTLNGIAIERNLVGAWLGAAALGLYAAGAAFTTMCGIIGNAVASLLLPRLSASHDRPAEQRQLIRTWLPVTALLLALVVVSLQVVVEPIIRIAFGTAFLPAVPVARWLLVSDALFGFRRLLVCLLQVRGRGALASGIELALTAVMVAGIAVAAVVGDLVLVGVTLAAVGALSCFCMAVAIRFAPPRDQPRHRADA